MSQLTLALRGGHGRKKGPHGGKRRGAGRPNTSGRRGHLRRPRLEQRHPVHVTLKMVSRLPSLRRKEVFRCLRDAVKTARKQGFAVAHFAILSNHVHLIMEPEKSSLAPAIRSLTVSFAKRLNRVAKRKGAVFFDRYHLHVLKTPTEVRNALGYVLTNEARHRQGRTTKWQKPLVVSLDPFSSAWAFRDWKTLVGARIEFEISSWPEAAIEAWHSEILRPPKTWLLGKGWKRAEQSPS